MAKKTLGSEKKRQGSKHVCMLSPMPRCCYDFPHSYIIVYLHFFGHLFFILVLLIYDYSSTVCLLRRLFMHCSCAYSCAYSCTALLYSIQGQSGPSQKRYDHRKGLHRKKYGPRLVKYYNTL